MLSEEGYEAFRCTLQKAGYAPGDFEISTADAGDAPDLLHLEMTDVVVKYVPNDVTRAYKAGFGSYWLHLLENDLREGVYDRKK